MFPIIIFTEEMAYAVIGCLVFILLDMFTGIIYAFKSNTFSSSILREGFFHKVALVVVMVCAILIECLVMHIPSLGFSVPILVPACVIIILMEISSILENLVKINPELEGNDLLKLFASDKKE